MAEALQPVPPMTADPAWLIQRCRQGDTHAFRSLYRQSQGRVRSTLYQLCGATHLEDLVQEVFLRVWKGLPNLRTPDYFHTWLYRITWNVATDHRRHLGQNPPPISTQDQETTLDLPIKSPLQQPDLMRLHYQDLVQRGLASLPWEQGIVLVLHDLEDLPQKEIAQILEVPVGTVKSRLFHARRALRQYLEVQGVIL